ncbi:YihY/virulence factor BrkB family protein [Streptomyces sp. TR06-5]|uniref:YihY/virulence factor BrkB family protein n=1 Tax=unclassified Streptomyces TaxID=2593676 RepID=UPI0039A044D6
MAHATEPGREGPESRRPDPSLNRSGSGTAPRWRSWRAVLRRTGREFREDGLTDLAAALTYYGVLAVVPALIAVVSILGLLGTSAVRSVIDELGGLAPGPVKSVLTSMLEQIEGGAGGAGLALALGVLIALWSASGYVAAFMRAGNAVHDVRESRPLWKVLPVRFLTTVAVLTLLTLVAVAVVVSGGVARTVGGALGLGDTAVTAWNIAKWPVAVLLVGLVIALLYRVAPDVARPFRQVLPGALLAVLIGIAASALFAVYVAHFGSYNETYGSLAGIVVFLVWLWITNIAVLLGLEFNAELAREPAGEEPQEPQEPEASGPP